MTGLFNILSTFVFRLENTATGMSFSTWMHIIAVAGSALFVIVGSMLIGFNYQKHFQWGHVKSYTLISVGILLAGGAISPLIISNDIPIVGLVERVSIIAYYQWFVVMITKFYHETVEADTQQP